MVVIDLHSQVSHVICITSAVLNNLSFLTKDGHLVLTESNQ